MKLTLSLDVVEGDLGQVQGSQHVHTIRLRKEKK